MESVQQDGADAQGEILRKRAEGLGLKLKRQGSSYILSDDWDGDSISCPDGVEVGELLDALENFPAGVTQQDIHGNKLWSYDPATQKITIHQKADHGSAAEPQAEPIDRECEIERLANLEPLDYEQARNTAANRLGVRASVLDVGVKKKRRELGLDRGDASDGQGQAVEVADLMPWHEPVEGDHIAEALRATIKRYAVISDSAADMIAIWVLLSWTLDNFSIAPRLAVTSPTKGCGKSTILDLVARLSCRPLSSGSVTPAALFRAIEVLKPTLILDEQEKYLEAGSDFHALLNEGHRRGGKVLRVLGDGHELRAFSTFAMVAYARNGKIPDDLEQRSIKIEMNRRLANEKIDQLKFNSPHLDDLARMCCRWAMDYAGDIPDFTDPDMGGLINRTADNWRPLFAIADVVGGDWPARIRDAAADLAPKRDGDSDDTMLLADIKAVFDERGIDRLASDDLCETLACMEGKPWAEYGRSSKPITKNQLARRLDRFAIHTDTIRIGDKTPKGYYRRKFADAWKRYLGGDPLNEPQHRNNDDVSNGYAASEPQHQTATSPNGNATPAPSVADRENLLRIDVADRIASRPLKDKECCGVAVEKGDTPLKVCAHCRKPGGEILPVAYGDASAMVHPGCRDAWIALQDIPPFLDRRSELRAAG